MPIFLKLLTSKNSAASVKPIKPKIPPDAPVLTAAHVVCDLSGAIAQ